MSRIVCVSNRVSLPDPETGEIKAGGLAVGIAAALENQGECVWFGWDGTIAAGANFTQCLPSRTQANGQAEQLRIPAVQVAQPGLGE